MKAILSCLPRSADDYGTLAAMGCLCACAYLILTL